MLTKSVSRWDTQLATLQWTEKSLHMDTVPARGGVSGITNYTYQPFTVILCNKTKTAKNNNKNFFKYAFFFFFTLF